MSTISASYPDLIRAQRVSAVGKILVLSSLVVLTVLILMMVLSAHNAVPTGQAADSQTSIAPIAVPVPTPSITEIQPVPSDTPAFSSGETREPSAVPVPVPSPPSQ